MRDVEDSWKMLTQQLRRPKKAKGDKPIWNNAIVSPKELDDRIINSTDMLKN